MAGKTKEGKAAKGSKDPTRPSDKVLAELGPAPHGCEWLVLEKFGDDPVLIESNHPLVIAARS
jgi:hypothetical protein